MGENLVLATRILNVLLNIATQFTEVIAKAQQEGRDVTDTELEILKNRRKQEVDELLGR